MLIAELTLFFRREDLDLSMNTSLTIMLVMYTMYQSISMSLPQTAYVKFIDVWIIFCLLVPFCVFVIHFFGKIESKKYMSKIDSHLNTRKRQQHLIIVFVPVGTIIFVLMYIAVAIYFYSNPWLLRQSSYASRGRQCFS